MDDETLSETTEEEDSSTTTTEDDGTTTTEDDDGTTTTEDDDGTTTTEDDGTSITTEDDDSGTATTCRETRTCRMAPASASTLVGDNAGGQDRRLLEEIEKARIRGIKEGREQVINELRKRYNVPLHDIATTDTETVEEDYRKGFKVL